MTKSGKITETYRLLIKLSRILLAQVNVVKKYGLFQYIHDLLKAPVYSLYKIFSINPKYLTAVLKSTVDIEEKLFCNHIKYGDIVLDAGCGDGRNGLKIVEELNLNPKTVVLLDINADYLKKLARFVGHSRKHHYSLVRGNIFYMGFSNSVFNVAICTGAVLSVAYGDSISAGLLELSRTVKTNGIVIFSVITKERLFKTAEERGRLDIKEEILLTSTYPNWNEQYGEGICKGWDINDVDAEVGALGLEILSKDIIYDNDIPVSVILACKKKADSK